ncbi:MULTISPECIES: hypothetical protein [Bradyrhizobium]
MRYTAGVVRSVLAEECLQEIRLWPGCEAVAEVGVLGDPSGGFSVHVVHYGTAKKWLADRAIRCITREKLRWYHLEME